jgi:hypothetical protein
MGGVERASERVRVPLTLKPLDAGRNEGETDMSESGKRDKLKREKQKKAKLTLKQKRQMKRDKKN